MPLSSNDGEACFSARPAKSWSRRQTRKCFSNQSDGRIGSKRFCFRAPGMRRAGVSPASGARLARPTIRRRARRATTAAGTAALLWSFHSDDYFSARVPFFQIPHRLRHFIQPVTLVDDRRDLSGSHELAQGGEVLFAEFGHEHDEVLADEA